MRILFDHNVPASLADYLAGHEVELAASLGWEEIPDGELLQRACQDGYDLLITADQGIRNQQRVVDFPIAIVELSTPNWPRLDRYHERVRQALSLAIERTVLQVFIPYLDQSLSDS